MSHSDLAPGSVPPVVAPVEEARLTGDALAAFADFAEDLEPTRAMQREDIPNEPMLLARRAVKSHADTTGAIAAEPEVIDFAARMQSEPPAAIVPAPRASAFAAPPSEPVIMPDALPDADLEDIAESLPLPPLHLAAARAAPPKAPPAKPLPAKPLPAKPARPLFPPSSAADQEASRVEEGSLAPATVEAPPPPRREIVPPPAFARRAEVPIAQRGALVFLGACALAAAGLIGISVGRSTAPLPAGQPVAAVQAASPAVAAQPAAVAAMPPAVPAAVPPAVPQVAAPEAGAAVARAPGVVVATAVKGGAAKADGRDAKTDKAPERAEAAVAAPPADGPVAPAFDGATASSALSALSGSVQSCGQGEGGTARVSVTFAPSGRVTQAIVEGAPYAGTPAGGCIAAKARSASIPAFSGAAVTVRKTYSMN